MNEKPSITRRKYIFYTKVTAEEANPYHLILEYFSDA
jgi:hypothetical protein